MIISYQLLIFQNYSSLRHWHTRLVSSWVSLTSWGEGASLALVGNPSIDGATIKMLYGVDVLDWPALHPIFPNGLVKIESGFIVRSVETFSDLTCHLEDTGIGFWLHYVCHQRVRRPNLDVATKRFLHQQVKIPR